MSETEPKTVHICATCPWIKANQGRRIPEVDRPAGWYTKANLRRLWTGLRHGHEMICHSTDPTANTYGGKPGIKPGKEQVCAGALTLLIQNINAVSRGEPQPHQPPLSKRCITKMLEQHLFNGGLPAVDVPRVADVGLPWE